MLCESSAYALCASITPHTLVSNGLHTRRRIALSESLETELGNVCYVFACVVTHCLYGSWITGDKVLFTQVIWNGKNGRLTCLITPIIAIMYESAYFTGIRWSLKCKCVLAHELSDSWGKNLDPENNIGLLGGWCGFGTLCTLFERVCHLTLF
jgi:hypothetical protein